MFKLCSVYNFSFSTVEQIDWNTIKGDEERNKSLRLLKTVSQWLSGMWTRSYGCQPEAQLLLLPYLFAAESSDTDKELARECSLALCFISATVLRPSTIEVALKIIKEVAHQGSWKARIASLEFLQVRHPTPPTPLRNYTKGIFSLGVNV